MAKNVASKKAAAQLRDSVETFLGRQQNNVFDYNDVARSVGIIQPGQVRQIALMLAELAFDGELEEVAPGRYTRTVQRSNVATGTFVRRSNGKNSVISDDGGEAIFVAERNSMHALNGDRVKINIAARRPGQEAEAEVIEILKKKPQNFIGTLQVNRNIAFLKTDSKYLATDIFIPHAQLNGGVSGDKAVVKITQWPDDAKNPIGEVIDILGRTGENNAEQHAILAEFGLPYKYPTEVERAADHITAGITPEEVACREDMRDVTTFTIDPHDAKDFDDALSLRRLPNGNYEVGVHIADVTHYVKPGSIIDKEAQERATSVYLVDRVVPMLPEHLCNGICSLRPDEDKLTFSCIFELDDQARVLNHRIVRTVIRSNRRFAYEEAQEVIEKGEGDLADEILTLDRLAKKLRAERYANGSIDFDREEVRFEIDETGHPVDVYFKESKDANKLIEEFMLLANKTVAAEIGKVGGRKKAKPFVYRVHDVPDSDRLTDLASIARTFGYKIKTSGSPAEINRSINRMLEECRGKGEENYLSVLAIRSMAKAIYTTENIGHYGLGFDYYTHFTSPIRRYPDMMVHRLLERYIPGGRAVNRERLEEECKHSSDQEQLAANAERASIKYKQVEYMADHLGEEYDGIISGVTEWGIYVELDANKCEGLVMMRDLADDYYEYDERNYCIRGRRGGIVYRLGDKVRVRVANTNLDKRQLDFQLVDPHMQRPGEDVLGSTLSVSQALGNFKPKKVKKSTKSTKSSKENGSPKASKSHSSGSSKKGTTSKGAKSTKKRRSH